MQPGRELKGEVEAPRQKGDGWFHEVILRPVPSSNSLGGAAFRKCGIHAGVHFPMGDLPWVSLRKLILGGFWIPDGFGSAGAFQRCRQPL